MPEPRRIVGAARKALPIAFVCLAAAWSSGCARLPSLEGRTASTAFAESDRTRLGIAVAPGVAAHPGKSGIHLLADARDAFAARMLLAAGAERSLDVQYYIWHLDMTGSLLFEALHAAADRGVRVRLLLDDNNTAGLDPALAALDSHPNAEVRLFNPFVLRSARLLGYLSDFSRLNRRMHNKSFTADSKATIIGGRNVGDEYFGATDGVLFADLDVLAVGPVVDEVTADFDRYWASDSSYPVDRLLPPVEPARLARLASEAARVERDPAAATYMDAIRESSFLRRLLNGELAFEWAPTRMISDDPAKGLGRAQPEGLLSHDLKRIFGNPRSELLLVSPYFVPGAAGERSFIEMAGRGVTVQILTNSLEATDVAAVHAGYAKRRRALLSAGVTLYESRRQREAAASGNPSGPMGSSASSLHAKTFAVDGTSVFVGSFNFDPRSAHLNTELGFVIDSAELASRVRSVFAGAIPDNSYRVHLSPAGELFWTERRAGRTVRHDVEPGTGFWQRALVRFISLLPVEWLL